jgi:hypothetical protein
MTRFSKQDDENKICITKGGNERQFLEVKLEFSNKYHVAPSW